ncbi:MAG TPA: ATP-binding protein [Polyangiaceae bacterium]|nr:ATP-binding protein [Polyangiaceae bacterium]
MGSEHDAGAGRAGSSGASAGVTARGGSNAPSAGAMPQGGSNAPHHTVDKATEAQLLLADRMACMGMLAAAVVHELNTPLGYTIANVGYALEALRALDAVLDAADGEVAAELASRVARARASVQTITDALREARQGGDRVRLIVRDLKMFSAPDDERRGPVDLRRVLESSINMAYSEIRHRARLVKDYGAVPLAFGSEARLGQVFVNLLINAAQAIREGAVDQNLIRVVTRTDGDGRCVVEVSDTGHGIAPENLRRIFDPFFTTKQKSGTGLGLSICQTIVASLGGEISVESETGRGSTFRVCLPGASDSGIFEATSRTRPPGRPSARGRILVVDDEPMMARAVQRLLDAEHDVVATSDPREAVDRVVGGARFDAILCDLMMPTMTGMEVYEAIAQAAPDQARRMVFMTGGAFTPRAIEFLEEVDNPRIEKPLEHAALRAVLRMHLSE